MVIDLMSPRIRIAVAPGGVVLGGVADLDLPTPFSTF
jgi:hypothetical protein